MMHIQTPATTANMGPGFDCIGMALSLYNHLWVEPCDGPCRIECKNDPENLVPRNPDNHLIVKSMQRFYQELGLGTMPGVHLIQEDFIPMTRGLGSSAACIISGLTAANALSGAGLGKDELAFLASHIEGHPDNAAPAILGGLIIGVLTSKRLEYIKVDNAFIRGLRFAVMIPAFPLETEKARKILPESYSREDVIFNASRTALLSAAFLTGDIEKLALAMDDRIHQPYRQTIIPGMEAIFEKSKAFGANSVFLSGAGPAMIAITQQESFLQDMGAFLGTLPDKWDIAFIEPDFNGTTIIGG